MHHSSEKVFIFNFDRSCFSSAVFSSFSLANTWIQKNYLSGVLTEYPLNQGSYDWAIEQGYFKVKSPIDRAPIFIGSFISTHQKRWYFKDGEVLEEIIDRL
ncbi:DUF7710 domain-containing protein [Acinetobacter silvestris]|uniref:DUF7710 domain-containing protein n=1 Tax=Acinetobacter silvestris TaxID=1977882 RepID=A0A1Y3CKK2_9GAMM|nr:hypothetical protein [Acinetobacter silvestris]OTG67721.1 hypothetical protein B9T28_03310 [Acinetobacter silvestris]